MMQVCQGCVHAGQPHAKWCPTLLPDSDRRDPTLRQRYAMAALTGLLASPSTDECTWAQMAVSAFDCADAMIAAEKAETP